MPVSYDLLFDDQSNGDYVDDSVDYGTVMMTNMTLMMMMIMNQ